MTSSKNTKPKKRLDWSHRALHDRRAIFDYIAIHDFSPLNAILVNARILESASLLETFAHIGKPYMGLRVLPVSKTQFIIVYKILATSVRILRISHQKQKRR